MEQSDSRDRPVLIQITPEMIEAGASVVFDFRAIADDHELASRVCSAMLEASELPVSLCRHNG